MNNAFGGSPSVTTTWLSRPGETGTNAGGFGQSINASGCVVMKGDRPNATQNAFYNGGAAGSSTSWAIPMATPGSGSIACWTTAINNAGYALCAAMPAVYTNAWVVNTLTVGGQATTTFDQTIPAPAGGLTTLGTAINNNTTPQVVGYSYTGSYIDYPNGQQTTEYTDPEATIWTYGAATATSLYTYASGSGTTNVAGWTSFTDAEGINNNGEIVGYGMKDGVMHAFALLNYSGPGDANGDNKVDINDLTIVLTNYNKSGMPWFAGDFNADGKVDINDLTIVLSNYNHTYGSSAAGLAAVPEPGSLLLLMLAAAGLLAFFRRKPR